MTSSVAMHMFLIGSKWQTAVGNRYLEWAKLTTRFCWLNAARGNANRLYVAGVLTEALQEAKGAN